MKILLIRPYGIADELIPPIGLGYLAGSIPNCHEVKILDCLNLNMNESSFRKYIENSSFDLYGISIFTKDLPMAKIYFEIIKKNKQTAVTVVGGPHMSVAPKKTFDFFKGLVDYAFVGEAEIGFIQLIEALNESKTTSDQDFRKIPGLIWKCLKSDKIMVNSNIFSDNLDQLRCRWDLIPPSNYLESPHGAFYKNKPIAPIIVTRGCPYPCTFCMAAHNSGTKIRSRSLDNVWKEILTLYHEFGVREFHIEDDNFTLKKQFVEKFCEKIIMSGLEIPWTCPNGIRLENINRELAHLMKTSGCYFLSIGIESGSQRVLDLMKKKIKLEFIEKQINLLSDIGFGIGGFFIIGYPGETMKEIIQTIRFAKSIPLSRASFSIFTPYPGTPIFRELQRRGEIEEYDLEKFSPSLHNVSWNSNDVSQKTLSFTRKKALIQFYSRPKIILQMLKDINSISHFWIVGKRAYRWLTV